LGFERVTDGMPVNISDSIGLILLRCVTLAADFSK
jgi:hypothetical protein